MKSYKGIFLAMLAVLTLLFIAGCGNSDVDVVVMKGEDWVKLDKETQKTAVEELLKASTDDKAKDHTANYYVRQLNSFFGASGTSSKLVKDAFQELAVSGKTVDELTIVNGVAWKKLSKDEKLKILEEEVKDISDKNPAFKPKALEEYYRELEEIYQKEDDKFLNQPVSETIQKLLTNNLIINGELIQ